MFVVPTGAATPRQVEDAIEKAIAYLYSTQNAEGHWELPSRDLLHLNTARLWGGQTALVTYALLAARESPQDPRLARAIKFLKTEDIELIYGLGLRCQVWMFLPDSPEVRKAIRNDVATLLKAADKDGRYGYSTNVHGGEHNSTSQYGVLGVWACAQMGAQVPASYWAKVEKGWKECQGKDGGWQYASLPPKPDASNGYSERACGMSTPAMTAAGIATLFITQDYLRANAGRSCQANIDLGLKWMADHFDLAMDGGGYTLYGIERIGVASGYKYFNAQNWYDLGTDHVVQTQKSDGSWLSRNPASVSSISETSFNLLFLVRGRAPVVMNKLQYIMGDTGKDAKDAKDKTPIPSNWNQRPRDVANAIRWIGRQMERDLNWQIVNLNVSADDLLDSPILYISGDQPLNFSQEHMDKLRQFVEQGGLILGNADGGKAEVANSFRRLGQLLFPEYEFRELPADHPIYQNQQFVRTKWASKPSVLGLSNGARELMILIPQADAAKAWQMQASNEKPELFQLAADIFQYSVDKRNLRYKGETFVVRPDPQVKPTSTLKVARLQYQGVWNPEPGGWRRLALVMRNQFAVELVAEPVKLGKGKLAEYKVAHLTGVSRFALSAAARAELKEFLKKGGTLVVDAAGGSLAFAEAAEGELKGICGEDLSLPDKTLPLKHGIYTLSANPIETVDYRNYARKILLSGLKKPRIRGVESGGRTAVFYSPEDLSVGLVGQLVDGINGYDPKSATAIMSNILLYAAGLNPTHAAPDR